VKKKRASLEEEQAALARAIEDPTEARAALISALASKRSFVVAHAARAIAQRQEELGAQLVDAFDRFLIDAVKADPGCHAKRACIEALDTIEWNVADPFVRAARWVQKEPAWGLPVDTAGPVRAIAIVALAKMGWSDAAILAGQMLADPEPPVRQSAADAIAHVGPRAAAGALMLKLEIGDPDPMVTLAILRALIELAPEHGLARAKNALAGETREIAALALGQSKDDAALTILLEALDECAISTERPVLLNAVAMHRSDRALEVVLSYFDRSARDASAAIEALRVRRFEPNVVARVREAAARANIDSAAVEAALAE
jgi:HEAT repeat protein